MVCYGIELNELNWINSFADFHQYHVVAMMSCFFILSFLCLCVSWKIKQKWGTPTQPARNDVSSTVTIVPDGNHDAPPSYSSLGGMLPLQELSPPASNTTLAPPAYDTAVAPQAYDTALALPAYDTVVAFGSRPPSYEESMKNTADHAEQYI